MYFDSFETYQQAAGPQSNFCVVVTLIDGRTHTSGMIEKRSYDDVCEDIAEMLLNKTVLLLWSDKTDQHKAVATMILHNQIQSIQFVFG